MKIVTWNCQGALNNKLDDLFSLTPDLAVIPEMASPAVLRSKLRSKLNLQAEWIGQGPNKGLGVLINPEWEYRIADCFDPRFELFLPIEVLTPQRFNVLAVWAFNHRAKNITPAANATNNVLKFYADWIGNVPTLILGDFNNSVIWDKPSSLNNFMEIVATLEELEQASIYHQHYNQSWGEEQDSTLFMYRKQDAGYHVDYVFAHKDLCSKCEKLTVGHPEEWLHISDHVPLSVDIAV